MTFNIDLTNLCLTCKKWLVLTVMAFHTFTLHINLPLRRYLTANAHGRLLQLSLMPLIGKKPRRYTLCQSVEGMASLDNEGTATKGKRDISLKVNPVSRRMWNWLGGLFLTRWDSSAEEEEERRLMWFRCCDGHLKAKSHMVPFVSLISHVIR